MKTRQLPFLLLATSLWFPATAFPQQETATITGFVRDQSGAVVPNATITVTNAQTNITVIVETNAHGAYTVGSLRPGQYIVAAERSGFTKTSLTGIALRVAQVASVDLTLAAGPITETVEVSAATSVLDSQTSSRGLVIDQKNLAELPLNGRDYNQLALLAPGVLAPTPRLSGVMKGAFNVNGNRALTNGFLLDGVDNMSYSNSFRGENVQLVQPSIEALQEFKIQTNAYSAEFGRGSGAVVNATIKSGTNALRGSVYEFFRDDALDATNFFSNARSMEKPKRERHQFGGAAGGPLVRDRSFWFADYEGLRSLEGVPHTRRVPTAAEKAGSFSTAVFDPFAPGRPAFERNADGKWVIPPDRWDPVGAAIVKLIPDPNAGDTLYASTPVTDTRQDQFDVRIDHNLSRNLALFGRYSFVDTLTFRPAPLPGLAEGSSNDTYGASDNRSQGVALGLRWTMTPNLLGDLRFGYGRGDYYTTPPHFGVDGPAEIGLRNVPNDPSIMGGLPKMFIQGLDPVGRHTSTPQFQTPRSWNPRATLSWSRGAHFIKFGAEFLHVETRINDLNATIGRIEFENRFTNRAVGDLLLGLPSRFTLTSLSVMDQGQNMQFYFIQDDYRVTPTLTANIGMRYEYATPPVENENRFANFDPETGTMKFAGDGSLFERALVHPDRNNLAPRIGFAYTPWSRLVVRAGYGVFFTHTVRQGREGLLGFNPPYLLDRSVRTSVTGGAAMAPAAAFRLVDGYPQNFLSAAELAPTVLRRAQDPHQRTPYIQQYNAGVQFELGRNLALDVAFVGNKGTKLNGFRNLNQATVIDNPDGSQSAGPRPYPAFGDIQWMENRVSSTYKSLQIALEKRFSGGLTGMASYTWGEAMTDAPDHLSTTGGGAGVDIGVSKDPQNSYDLRAERGPAEFDITHRFVASYVWELPLGRDRRFGAKWNRAVDFLLGGWQIAGTHVVQSGLPLTATISGSSVLDLGGERRTRPNLVGNPELPKSDRTLARWFNTDAFVAFSPTPRALGNAGVGILRGPGYVNFDVAVAKNFRIDRHRYAQFRTEFFNAFNHANFMPPNMARDSSGFGQIVSAASARNIQLGLKFYF